MRIFFIAVSMSTISDPTLEWHVRWWYLASCDAINSEICASSIYLTSPFINELIGNLLNTSAEAYSTSKQTPPQDDIHIYV